MKLKSNVQEENSGGVCREWAAGKKKQNVNAKVKAINLQFDLINWSNVSARQARSKFLIYLLGNCFSFLPSLKKFTAYTQNL